MRFSQGAEWNALISRYIGTIPPNGEACCMVAQRKSGSPPKAVNSAMMANVGVAARHSQSAATWAADPRLLPRARLTPLARDIITISDMIVPQRLPVVRSSEYPAFTRGHCTIGRSPVR